MANPLSPMLVQLLERLTENESLQIEFKDARGGLPRSIWETVSAFANTEGGWVILGVNDKREIVGVPNPEHQVDELHSQSRNRQIISWAAFGPGDVSTEALGARQVVVVRVWAAPRAELPVHLRGNPFQGTYLRRGTGDYQATEAEVKRMLRDAGGDSSADGRAIPGLGTDALDMRTVAAYRQSFRLRKPSDAWNDYDNERFLVALGATVTGVDGPEVTRAGVLMFGRDQALRAWRGRHLIDYRETDRLLEGRWQDRVVVESGLYDAFREIYPRLTVGLPTPFRLDGVTRVDEGPAQIAVREALVNLLVHADYVEQQPSLILRSPDEILFRNPGTSRVPVSELFGGDRSDARNPTLLRMFRLAGLAEEAGSGFPTILKAWRELGRSLPEPVSVSERYEFQLKLRMVHLVSEADRAWLAAFNQQWTEEEQLALLSVRHTGSVSNGELRRLTGQHMTETSRVLVKLRDRGFLEMSGDGPTARYAPGRMILFAQVSKEQLPLIPPQDRMSLTTANRGLGDNDPSLGDSDGGLGDNDPGLGDNDGGLGDNDPRLGGRITEFGPEIASPGSPNTELSKIVLQSEGARQPLRRPVSETDALIIRLCSVRPLSLPELATLLHRDVATIRLHVRRLVEGHHLQYELPDRPTSPKQRYLAPQQQ